VSTWRLLDTGVRSAHENIALDEAIVRSRAEGASPDTIRFLQYAPPAVLIGYHQSPSQEIRLEYCAEHDIALGRRITGGGAIFFDEGQLGWEIVASRGASNLPENTSGLYRTLCGAVARGLQKLGVEAAFRPRNDIEVSGRKISGTGGMEEGNAFLFQGTLLVDFDLETMIKALRIPVQKLAAKEIDSMRERVTWLSREMGRVPDMADVKSAIADALAETLDVTLEAGDLNDRERALFEESMPHVSSKKWLYRVDRPLRERGYFSAGIRTDGGTIRVDASVDTPAKRIQYLAITGDFFCEPRRAILDLESHFKDVPVERPRIHDIVHAFVDDESTDLVGFSGDELEQVVWDAARKGTYGALGFSPEEADRINVAGGDLLDVLDRGPTRLLLPYCAKRPDCGMRHTPDCSLCGRCDTSAAYDLGRELSLEPTTITSFEDLEVEWRKMADEGVPAYIGSCCEQFFTKHRLEFEATPVPGVLVDLESATCYDLGKARDAHAGTFEGFTELKLGLIDKVCRLAAQRRANVASPEGA
jgi:lipoate-protein ligase A